MKTMFRKALTVLGSTALLGATVGVAAAASYPEPFTSNTAIVTGANAAPSDLVAATGIKSDLDAESTGSTTTTTAEGGEVFSLGKSSDEFQLGYNLGSVFTSLDDNDMTDFLADGNYDDGDIDEDYTQIITLGTSPNLGLFADTTYDDDKTPTIGFHFDDDLVLSYTLEFDTALTDYSDLESTDMPLMGREYFVLSAGSSTLDLLDSAESTIVTEGTTVEIDGKDVSIEYITATSAKFKVDGELTDKLYDDAANGDKYYELDDESYIVLNENLYESKETGLSKAEVSIGKGKISLAFDGSEIEINDEPVDGLTSTITTDGSTAVGGVATDNVQDITLSWTTDGEEFLVEGGSMVMPGFEAIKVLFGGLDFPSDSEELLIGSGDTLTIEMGNFDLDVLYATAEATVTMGDEDRLLHLNATAATQTTFYLADDDRFIATYLDTDLSDVEMLYYEAGNLDVGGSNDEFSLDLNDLIADKDIEFDAVSAGDDDTSRGDVTVTLDIVYEAGAEVNATGTDSAVFITEATAALINATNPAAFGGGNATDGDTLLVDIAQVTVDHDDSELLHWDKVVSETGMVVEIEASTTLAGTDDHINFYEQTDDGDLTWTTPDFIADAQWDTTDSEVYAVDDSSLNLLETTTDDLYLAYIDGDLATMLEVDEDANTYTVTYYGEEVVADVSIASADAVLTSTTSGGVKTILDSEAEKGMNLIVVGGSAINSVAADLLGGAYRGDVFESMTSVGDGEFLIQSFNWDGDVALLVAGYNAADTQKAALYLQNFDVDTSVGTKYIGSSATTEATMVDLV